MRQEMNENILEINDLAVSFSIGGARLHALRGVSLSLRRGETLALVGESGSGKSVTSRAILGILPKNARVDGGSIKFCGKELIGASEKELCTLRGRQMAMIFQDPTSALDPIVKVGRQISEVIRLDKRVGAAEARRRAVALMGEVGIPDPDERYDRYPFEFSGGMRQRIVIAIALAASPRLLICDEPTTALDVSVQARLLDLFERLKKERDLSMLFISHDLGVVARVADSIAVMYAGKILEYGKSEEIFYSPAHPYTRALLASVPDPDGDERPRAIEGAPPDMRRPPAGDPFAARNPDAMIIDYERFPPYFQLSPTHFAASWTLHPLAPPAEMPDVLKRRIEKRRSR
jgi:oligopeptide transport system ATP-binding protein